MSRPGIESVNSRSSERTLYQLSYRGRSNPRDFYLYSNSKKKDTQGIPLLKRKNGKGVAQSELEKANPGRFGLGRFGLGLFGQFLGWVVSA